MNLRVPRPGSCSLAGSKRRYKERPDLIVSSRGGEGRCQGRVSAWAPISGRQGVSPEIESGTVENPRLARWVTDAKFGRGRLASPPASLTVRVGEPVVTISVPRGDAVDISVEERHLYPVDVQAPALGRIQRSSLDRHEFVHLVICHGRRVVPARCPAGATDRPPPTGDIRGYLATCGTPIRISLQMPFPNALRRERRVHWSTHWPG